MDRRIKGKGPFEAQMPRSLHATDDFISNENIIKQRYFDMKGKKGKEEKKTRSKLPVRMEDDLKS
jgi:hypothetical protein